MAVTPLLQITELQKRYGENSLIISGLSHRFEGGSATGLVGANGAGKTTFLRLISAAAFPTSGEVAFNGFDIHQHVHRYLQHVGIVSDTSDMPQFLTADELVEAVMRSRGVWDEKNSPEQKAALFDLVELDERRTGLIGTYSSGMMQKTMIAAALAGNPSILLLDEPFRALDESAVESVMNILKDFVSKGNILLVSSHQKSYLEALCTEYIEFPYVR
ncbi:MAG: ABC transporter ATP-binding protein [Bacteroidetes bacterium]|nr:ABC transporter ATP-binding protein [Bacteroidota bacterium]MCH8523080.1 ABC transporter ATP-binding protein [Balneolales bacterium]